MDLIVIEKPERKEVLSMSLYERMDRNKIARVLNTDILDGEDDEENVLKWKHPKASLMKYYKEMKNDLHRTKYICKTNSKYGRVRPKDEMGVICMMRTIRNFLMADDYYDIDMKSCHVSIMLSLLKVAGFEEDKYENWMQYYTNRDSIIDGLKEWNPNIDWKTYITSIVYGGNQYESKNHPFLLKLVFEIKEITAFFKQHNPKFYDYIKRQKDKKNIDGSFLSNYLMEHEYRIIEQVIMFLYYETKFLKYKGVDVLSYEYDGFKILKENIPNMDAFLTQVNKIAREKYPLVEFVNKPMTEMLELPAMETIDISKYEEQVKMTDEMIVDILEECEGNNIIYTGSSWYYFDGIRWLMYEKEPHKFKDNIFKNVETYFRTHVPEEYSVFWDTWEEKKYLLQSNHVRKNVIEMSKNRFYREKVDFFDTNEMLLGFQNGVYDLEHGVFRPYRYDDYMTFSTGYDYEEREEDKIAFLYDNVFNKIHTDPLIRNLVLTIRASGLCGKNVERFIILNGGGRNGKSLEDDFQKHTMGYDYCKSCDPRLLTKPIPDSGLSPSHAALDLKRFVFVQEVKENVKLDNDTIKSLTGGGDLDARKCNSNITLVRKSFTLVCECNERPLLSNKAKFAEKARWIDILYESRFSEDVKEDDWENKVFVENTIFKQKTWINEYKMSFMHILLDHFKVWKDNNYVFQLPEKVKQRSLEYLLDCNPIHGLFKQLYEHDKEYKGVVHVNTIYHEIINLQEYHVLTHREKRLITREALCEYLNERSVKFCMVQGGSSIKHYKKKNLAPPQETFINNDHIERVMEEESDDED